MTGKLFRIWDAKKNAVVVPDKHLYLMTQIETIAKFDQTGKVVRHTGIVHDWFTGFRDRDATPVYANDLVAFHHSYWTHSDGSPISAVVTWDQKMGAWWLVNTENSKFRVLLSKHIRKGKVIGRKA